MGHEHELFSFISSSMYLLLSSDYMERGEGNTEEEKELHLRLSRPELETQLRGLLAV